MRNMDTLFNNFTTQFVSWAQAREDIIGIALVGSWARNEARPDSDVDLVIIVENPKKYTSDTSWAAEFGEITEQSIEDWGPLTSVRVFYEVGLEVEFGFTSRLWAAINPVDQGTRRIVSDGLKILFDKAGLFTALKNEVDALTIRRTTMDDYDEFCRLMAQIDKVHHDAHPQYFRKPTPVRDRDFFESFAGDEERPIFVAEKDDKLVGVIMVEVRSTPDIPVIRPREFVLIETLVVDEESRSSGIGQALMQVAHEWGKARGIHEFRLGVYAFNERAIKFYQKLGYDIHHHLMVLNIIKPGEQDY